MELARREVPLVVLTALAAIAYSASGWLDHLHLSTSALDLGIYDQAVWHYSRLEAPASTLSVAPDVLPNLLGDHFHPILVLLAPLYWIADDVRMILVAQGVLIASSAIPVWLYAERRLGRAGAYALLPAYLGFWGIQTAVTTDFHEVAFAPLPLALAFLWADEERWGRCFAALAVLLLVKEDMAIVVAFFGLYLLTRGHRRQGAVALVGGAVAFVVVTGVVMPHFAGGVETYDHWTYDELGPNLPEATGNIVTSPGHFFETLFSPGQKRETMAYLVFIPFLGLALLSPVTLVAIPLVLERMLSSRSALWGTLAHYSLSIAPVLAIGAADGLARALAILRVKRPERLAVAVGVVTVVAALAVTPDGHRLGRLFDPGYWSPSERERAGQRAAEQVPRHADSVAAQSALVPHLSQRAEIWRLEPSAPETDWIVYDADDLTSSAVIASRLSRYEAVFREQGWVVLRLREDL